MLGEPSNTIQLIQETFAPSSQTVDRSFAFSVLESMGVRSEAQGENCSSGQKSRLFMCVTCHGGCWIKHTLEISRQEDTAHSAKDDQNGPCKDCIHEHGFLLSSGI